MKRLVSAIAAVALGVALAPQALAANTQVMWTAASGAPIAGTPSVAAGETLHFVLANFPNGHGLYAYEAVKPAAGARPTQTSASITALTMWISADPTAPSHPTQVLSFTIDNGNAWGADCAHQQCGLWFQFDHTNQADHSEDQFVPFNFVAGTAASTGTGATAAPTTAMLTADTLAVTANGKALTENVPGAIAYRTPLTFTVTTGSGATAAIKSYTPDLCPVTGNVVDALKGSGACDIAVTTPGDAMHAAKTAHFPLIVGPGVQNVSERITSVSIKYPMNLTQASNFGEAVSYKSTTPKICSTKGATVKGLKVGSCVLTATAMGSKGNYGDLKQKVVVAITK